MLQSGQKAQYCAEVSNHSSLVAAKEHGGGFVMVWGRIFRTSTSAIL